MGTVLEELASSVRAVADRVGPSVVGVDRSGSGLVVAAGLVVTNAHNLRREETRVSFPDGRSEPATLAAADIDGDLAVLRVDTGEAPAVEWAPEPARLGDVVFGAANPAGLGLRVSLGTVAAVGRSFRGPRGRRMPASIEHTAPLVRGSSGGPVVDPVGRVVGINTHRLPEGFYLALPTGAELRSTIDGLSRGEVRHRLRLGVALAPPHATRRLRAAVGLPELDGLLIRAVEEDTPAARAGLRRGDVLVSAGDRPLASPDDLHQALDRLPAGAGLELRVVRGVEELSVTITF